MGKFLSTREGIVIVLDNDFKVSLQMGEIHYADKQIYTYIIQADNAELAIRNKDEQWVTKEFIKETYGYDINDNVIGHIDYHVFTSAILWAEKQL